MILLACETSTSQGSLTLFKDGVPLATEVWHKSNSHSEFITLAFQNILKKTNTHTQQIDLFAVGTGPGSFTGIRVGINFIRALAQALNKHVINLNSLHLLAMQPGLSSYQKVVVMQYAFRNLIYVAKYTGQPIPTEEIAPKAVTPDQLEEYLTEKTLVIGTGYSQIKNHLPQNLLDHCVFQEELHQLPSAEYFRPLVEHNHYQGYLTDWIHTIPLYIRASEAEEKLKTGVLKPFK